MRISLSLLVLTLLLPGHAFAYLTPEDVLSQEDLSLPTEQTDETMPAEEPTDEDLHGAADDAPSDILPTDSDPSISQELRDQRILDRVERNRLNQQNDELVLHASAEDESLHGGAPLANTGMGTVVLMLAGSVAVGLTLRRALRA